MKHPAKCLIVGGFLVSAGVHAQQNVAKPVLSAPPAPQTSPVSPPAPLAGPQVVTNPAQVPADYVIGPADEIDVIVWKETSLSGTLTVRPDGMISMPLVGDLRAVGFTPMQLSSDIVTRLKKYVNEPLVTVNIHTINSKRIYLIGEVAHIGPMNLTAGMTLLQAISTAGGLSTFANAKHIYILRKVGDKEQKIPFNYKLALKSGNMQGVTLMPEDTIVVP